MAGYLYMLLAIYMREAENKNKLSRKESYVIKTIEYISSNYSSPITVNDMAAYVAESQLSVPGISGGTEQVPERISE